VRPRSIVLLAFVGLFLGVNLALVASGRMSFVAPQRRWGVDWDAIGVVVAAGLTLAMYTFLYEDNPVFKFAEHLYVGVATGYTICLTWFDFLKPKLWDVLVVPAWNFAFAGGASEEVEFSVLLPSLLGLMMFSRMIPKAGWLSRWSFAFVVGMGAGISIPVVISSFILEQVHSTLRPISFSWDGLWTALVLLGVLTVLVYFYFSTEHKGPAGWLARIGIWFLMISFGASFGFTIMGRLSLLIGRIDFLLNEWGHLDEVIEGYIRMLG
jgi:hypothetical protein